MYKSTQQTLIIVAFLLANIGCNIKSTENELERIRGLIVDPFNWGVYIDSVSISEKVVFIEMVDTSRDYLEPALADAIIINSLRNVVFDSSLASNNYEIMLVYSIPKRVSGSEIVNQRFSLESLQKIIAQKQGVTKLYCQTIDSLLKIEGGVLSLEIISSFFSLHKQYFPKYCCSSIYEVLPYLFEVDAKLGIDFEKTKAGEVILLNEKIMKESKEYNYQAPLSFIQMKEYVISQYEKAKRIWVVEIGKKERVVL